jgi:hypothetical protein
MYESISLAEYFYLKHKAYEDKRDFCEESRKRLDRLKKSSLSQISYPTFAQAYDYVDGLFPQAKVKDVVIYKVPVALMEKLGFHGVEGFYSHLDSTVVISTGRKPKHYQSAVVRAKIQKDETIVHELLHYAYVAMGRWNVSSQMREEFAYGWSIGYLRGKGYKDEEIIRYNFLPYLFSIVYEDAIRRTLQYLNITEEEFRRFSSYQRKSFFRINDGAITSLAHQLAVEQGRQLVKLYSKLIEEGTHFSADDESVSRFELMEFDD